MRPGGEYADRVEWLKRTAGTADGFGQRTDTFPSQGYLWAAVEDVSAGRPTEKESERQVTTATVRLRNYPAVAAGDHLYDPGRVETWDVLTAVRGDHEVICEVERR